MEFKYRMTASRIKDDLGNTHITYGIEAYAAIEDLSTDRRSVESLVKRCNRLALSPIHLKDVAEDFVAAEYSL